MPAALAQGAARDPRATATWTLPGAPSPGLGDGRATMALLARKLYREPDRALALIGVTGTNGKTTTTTLIRQLLRASGQGCGLMGSVLNAAGDREERGRAAPPRKARCSTAG